MELKRRKVQLNSVILLLGLIVKIASLHAQIVSPEEFVGFKVGEDKKLFGWDTVVDYFEMLGEKSDRITVQKLGKSTVGNPFIMAIISSSNNLLNLAKYKNLQKLAANPRQLSDDDARLIARDNKVVVMITLNVHAEEIASSQESIELAYLLATQNSSEVRQILDNVIILLVPSMNPDGMQRIVDWYNQHLDTPFEGSPFPYVSHPYAGQDNNCDWFMMNLVETRLMSRQYYHEWYPEIIYDQHQMQSESARLSLPSYNEQANPDLHPLLYEQMNKVSKNIVSDLLAQKKRGIVISTFYSERCEGTSTMTSWWHNMLGIRSAVADAQVATPLYFPKGSINGGRWSHSENDRYKNLSEPWLGGWWRLRDVIEYELAVTFSLLKHAAKEKESIIYNFCKMNIEAINKGKYQPPFAFVVPKPQHDPTVAIQMVDVLLQGGVEVHKADQDFFVDSVKYEKGSFVILMAQPFRSYAKNMLARQINTEFKKDLDNNSEYPNDMTGWTLPLMMGVETQQIDKPFDADLTQIKTIDEPTGYIVRKEKGNYLISHSTNRCFVGVNKLLGIGRKVFWLKNEIEVDGKTYQPGTVFVPYKEIKFERMASLAKEFGLEVIQTEQKFRGQEAYQIKKFNLGLYQPFTSNVDAGWTRFLLEKYAFPYKSIYNIQIRRGDLIDDYDVIIIPDIEAMQLIHGRKKLKPDIYTAQVPVPYQDGIREDGVNALKEFVENGGKLIVLDSACDFAIEQFGLPVENVLKNVKVNDFYCPGSLLEIIVDNSEPIAYGMPTKAAAVFSNSPALRPYYWKNRTSVAAYYPDYNSLLSGWITGEERIRGLSAVLEIPMGKGRIVLIGFRVQNRAQTEGTYKLLFNAIQLSQTEEVVIK